MKQKNRPKTREEKKSFKRKRFSCLGEKRILKKLFFDKIFCTIFLMEQ